MKAIGTESGIVAGFACPNCQQALPDYALSCPNCAADLRTTELRTTLTLDNSVNRKEQSIFYYVSPLKLIVMSIATFGIYDLFWFYKNWTYVNEHTNRIILPGVNAIFGLITCWGLINEIKMAGTAAGSSQKPPSPFLAVLYFLLSACGRAGGILLVPSALGILCLVPSQRYINSLNGESQTPINNKFSPLNWVTIVIGGGLYIMAIVPSLRP